MYIMKKNNTNKVWQITDLVKKIGKWKSEFEKTANVEQLNNNNDFQNLIYLLFTCEYDSGVVVRKDSTEPNEPNRLMIKICKHNPPFYLIHFEIYKKHKRTPCYDNIYLIEYLKETPLKIQRKLSVFILENHILLDFFK